MTYLVEERHMTMIKVGIFRALPFLGTIAGILSAGFLSDFFIRRGYSMSAARKAPLIIGTLLASCIVLVNFAESDAAVIAVLSVSPFAQGVPSSSWAAMSEIAPRQYIGLTSGVACLAMNLVGITTPLIIGNILQATGQFYWALNFMGLVCLLGAFCESAHKRLRWQLLTRAAMATAAGWLQQRDQLGCHVFAREIDEAGPSAAKAARTGDVTALLRACLAVIQVPPETAEPFGGQPHRLGPRPTPPLTLERCCRQWGRVGRRWERSCRKCRMTCPTWTAGVGK